MIRIMAALYLFSIVIFSQSVTEKREGAVTYQSSQNVYVKFENTQGISINDTLYTDQEIPAVIVKFISSRSVAGDPINGKQFKEGEKIVARVRREQVQDISKNEERPSVQPKSAITEAPDRLAFKASRKGFSGRLSINSYSNISSLGGRGDYQRWRYALSFEAPDLGNSGITISSYTLFSYRADEWEKVSENLGRGLKIYELSARYNIGAASSIWLGRQINRRVANLGTSDGLQYELLLNNYAAGVIIGSRPNILDMGFNIKLFQYGAYLWRGDTLNGKTMENSIGAFQQTNDFKTDRRFIYLQHSNSVFENISLLLSSEIDLYKKVMEQETNELSLTSLFFSARYAPVREVSVTASYDARKDVIYYETYKNFIDSLYENETRQGFRMSANVRPLNNLFIGLTGGYRYQKGDIRPSRNYTAYATYNSIPIIETPVNISYSNLISNYVTGTTYGIRLSRDFADPSVGIAVGFRKVVYEFERSFTKITQDEISGELNYRFSKEVSINFFYEGSFNNEIKLSRIMIGLTGRI